MGKTFTSKKKLKETEKVANHPLHENFRDYTTEELNRIKAEVCIRHKCPYSSRVKWAGKHPGSSALASAVVCNYILFEQHSRGCMPDVCEYWKNSGIKRRKDTDNQHLFNKHPESKNYF